MTRDLDTESQGDSCEIQKDLHTIEQAHEAATTLTEWLHYESTGDQRMLQYDPRPDIQRVLAALARVRAALEAKDVEAQELHAKLESLCEALRAIVSHEPDGENDSYSQVIAIARAALAVARTGNEERPERGAPLLDRDSG